MNSQQLLLNGKATAFDVFLNCGITVATPSCLSFFRLENGLCSTVPFHTIHYEHRHPINNVKCHYLFGLSAIATLKGGVVSLWDASQTLRPLQSTLSSNGIVDVKWVPNEAKLICVSASNGTVSIWDTRTAIGGSSCKSSYSCSVSNNPTEARNVQFRPGNPYVYSVIHDTVISVHDIRRGSNSSDDGLFSMDVIGNSNLFCSAWSSDATSLLYTTSLLQVEQSKSTTSTIQNADSKMPVSTTSHTETPSDNYKINRLEITGRNIESNEIENTVHMEIKSNNWSDVCVHQLLCVPKSKDLIASFSHLSPSSITDSSLSSGSLSYDINSCISYYDKSVMSLNTTKSLLQLQVQGLILPIKNLASNMNHHLHAPRNNSILGLHWDKSIAAASHRSQLQLLSLTGNGVLHSFSDLKAASTQVSNKNSKALMKPKSVSVDKPMYTAANLIIDDSNMKEGKLLNGGNVKPKEITFKMFWSMLEEEVLYIQLLLEGIEINGLVPSTALSGLSIGKRTI